MSEHDLVGATPRPRTRATLAADFRDLGLETGDTVLVHASLRSIGWTAGGPVAVVQALLDVVGETGTLVMPAHTSGNTDPGEWSNPPVPKAWHQPIREAMPGYDPRITPTRGMGAIAELFRSWPGAIRSNHPTSSYSAIGKHADIVCSGHELDNSLGESSPLARIYDLDGRVILLGVGYDRNTSFHLAEYRIQERQPISCGSAILRDGERQWATYRDIEFHDERFSEIGTRFETTGGVRSGRIGSATARLFSQPKAVDFARDWMELQPGRRAE